MSGRPSLTVSEAAPLVALALLAVVVIGGTGVVLTSTPDPSASGGAETSVAASPIDEAPSGAKSEAPEPALAEARAVVASADPIVVLVVGDSTGDELDEWVAEWARSQNDERTVTQRQWSSKEEEFASSSGKLGGDGPGLSIWNLSQPDAKAIYPTKQNRLDGVRETPDLVFYSFGHNNTPDDIGGQLRATRDAITKKWGEVPGVVILQNPSTGPEAGRQKATVNYLRTKWAPNNGLPTIDVWRAFNADGRPLESILLDKTNPNEEGTRVWTDVVVQALS